MAAGAGGTSSLTLVGNIIQYGLIGLLLVAILTKKFVVPRWTYDESLAQKDVVLAEKDRIIADKDDDIQELKESLNALQALTREQMIPALVRANQLSAEYVSEIAQGRSSQSGSGSGRRVRASGGTNSSSS